MLGASIAAPDGKGLIQDNRALPEILQGLEQLFGAGSAASLIVQASHVAPVLERGAGMAEPRQPDRRRSPRFASDLTLIPLLEAIMLVDSDAWQLFDSASKAKFRR